MESHFKYVSKNKNKKKEKNITLIWKGVKTDILESTGLIPPWDILWCHKLASEPSYTNMRCDHPLARWSNL